MEDRDDMLLEALTGLINAKFEQMDKHFSTKFEQMDKHFSAKFEQVDRRFDKLEQEIKDIKESHRQDIQSIKIYIENVLEKKLNAFYDNTVTITEYNALKKEVEELKKTVNDILRKIS